MAFIKELGLLIRRDHILGFYYIRQRIGLAFLFILMMLILSLYHFKQIALVSDLSLSQYTLTDVVIYLFRGVDFNVMYDSGARFPIHWLILLMMCPFIIGDFSREDIHQQSSMLFVRVRSRFSIWLSKLVYSITTVLMFYALYLIMIAFMTLVFFSFSLEWGEYSLTSIKPLIEADVSAFSFTVQTICLPIITSIVLSIVHNLLSIFIKPVYIMLVMLAMLIASVFSTTLLLPGSYSMMERFYLLDSLNGFTWFQVALYGLLSVSFVIILGYVFFKRMDIIGLRGE